MKRPCAIFVDIQEGPEPAFMRWYDVFELAVAMVAKCAERHLDGVGYIAPGEILVRDIWCWVCILRRRYKISRWRAKGGRPRSEWNAESYFYSPHSTGHGCLGSIITMEVFVFLVDWSRLYEYRASNSSLPHSQRLR